MTKRTRITLALTLIAGGALLFTLLRPGGPGNTSGAPVEKITVGVANIVSTALFDVAAAQDLFRKQGLEVEIVEYATGVLAADALLQKKLDVATATEFVAVTKHFDHPEVRILASIARPEMHELIARRDRGITDPSHLRGKRIAVTRHSSGDFFLENFLANQGIPTDGVTPVDLPPPGILAAIASGSVDAAMTWEPTVGAIKEQLGPNGVSWPGQSEYAYYVVLLTRDDLLGKHPAAAERLLRALLEAERYAAEHPAEAQEILARRPGYQKAAIAALWPKCDFRVRLDQDLLTLMEDEARWASRRKGLKPTVPNYLAVIHRDSLKKIKPGAVSIIH